MAVATPSALLLFDAAGAEAARLKAPGDLRAVAVSPDGSRVALGSRTEVWVLELGSGAEVGRAPAANRLNALAFAPDGSRLILGIGGTSTVDMKSTQMGVTAWTIGAPAATGYVSASGNVHSLAVSPDRRWVAAADSNGGVKLVDAVRLRRVRTFHGSEALLGPFTARGRTSSPPAAWPSRPTVGG